LALLASLAMICTISSRGSPLPPGNWCEALSTVWAGAELASAQAPAIPARIAMNFLMGILRYRRLGAVAPRAILVERNALSRALSKASWSHPHVINARQERRDPVAAGNFIGNPNADLLSR